jgi:hypothetical protein
VVSVGACMHLDLACEFLLTDVHANASRECHSWTGMIQISVDRCLGCFSSCSKMGFSGWPNYHFAWVPILVQRCFATKATVVVSKIVRVLWILNSCEMFHSQNAYSFIVLQRRGVIHSKVGTCAGQCGQSAELSHTLCRTYSLTLDT